MSRLTRDETAEPVSRDQILRHVRGQRHCNFPCSADHDEQDWQAYPVDPYSAIYVMTINTYNKYIHVLVAKQPRISMEICRRNQWPPRRTLSKIK